MNDAEWMIFQITFDERARYRTDQMETHSSMSMSKFLDLLTRHFYIKNKEDFFLEVKRAEIILIWRKTGEWEVQREDMNKSYNFEDLYILNRPNKEEKTLLETGVDKAKKIISNFWKKNKDVTTKPDRINFR
jgi:hypothetical protein